ncbi:hypothetical protein JW766_01910 [Candidatus Dojkabacteria bacterium]|nr:hypothetical protein [Candidatus Dojkabacteria bacterium]
MLLSLFPSKNKIKAELQKRRVVGSSWSKLIDISVIIPIRREYSNGNLLGLLHSFSKIQMETNRNFYLIFIIYNQENISSDIKEENAISYSIINYLVTSNKSKLEKHKVLFKQKGISENIIQKIENIKRTGIKVAAIDMFSEGIKAEELSLVAKIGLLYAHKHFDSCNKPNGLITFLHAEDRPVLEYIEEIIASSKNLKFFQALLLPRSYKLESEPEARKYPNEASRLLEFSANYHFEYKFNFYRQTFFNFFINEKPLLAFKEPYAVLRSSLVPEILKSSAAPYETEKDMVDESCLISETLLNLGKILYMKFPLTKRYERSYQKPLNARQILEKIISREEKILQKHGKFERFDCAILRRLITNNVQDNLVKITRIEKFFDYCGIIIDTKLFTEIASNLAATSLGRRLQTTSLNNTPLEPHKVFELLRQYFTIKKEAFLVDELDFTYTLQDFFLNVMEDDNVSTKFLRSTVAESEIKENKAIESNNFHLPDLYQALASDQNTDLLRWEFLKTVYTKSMSLNIFKQEVSKAYPQYFVKNPHIRGISNSKLRMRRAAYRMCGLLHWISEIVAQNKTLPIGALAFLETLKDMNPVSVEEYRKIHPAE